MSADPDLMGILQRLTRVETQVQEMIENHLPHLAEELRWIKDRLNRGFRPPWGVAMLIAFLSSACVGLLVAVVK